MTRPRRSNGAGVLGERQLGSIAAVTATLQFVIILMAVGRIGWEKFIHRETNLTEDFAGVIVGVATATGTFLLGHAIVIDGDEKLSITLQANDRELTQS